MEKKVIQKVTALFLIFIIAFVTVGCNINSANNPNPGWTNPSLSDPDEGRITEDTDIEDTLNEFITAEIYLKEIIAAEDKIEELLLGEDMINEVILCKTIYVPQGHIKEFSENSQTEQLFGSEIDFGALATKIAVGTGIIVTLVVLKKAGLPEPIASVVVGAASDSMKFSATGAAISSLYGGLIGAAEGIDETKRVSAVLGFVLATVGLISSVVNLITVIPSGGASSIGVVAGIKIAIAGISVLTAAAGTATSAVKAVKTLKATDAKNIDWNNIDWDKVGVKAAEQVINSAGDGFMWGSITGAIYGGAKGYVNYHKYSAPYSTLKERMKHVPKQNSPNGRWSGKRGESDFILNEPIKLSDGTVVTKVTYKNAIPDFSPYQKAQVKIIGMSGRYGANGNFAKADEALAKNWTQIKYNGKTWTARDISNFRKSNNLTWHEMNNMDYMQLVPTDVNGRFGHSGGCCEYRTMIGQSGGDEFD